MSSYSFEPKRYYISAITQASPAVVTTSLDHDIQVGEIVSFRIPYEYGMIQLNHRYYTVIGVTNDTLTMDVDTRSYIPFSDQGSNTQYPAQVIPAASGILANVIPATVALATAFTNTRV